MLYLISTLGFQWKLWQEYQVRLQPYDRRETQPLGSVGISQAPGAYTKLSTIKQASHVEMLFYCLFDFGSSSTTDTEA